jgi:AraC-like DNA-binding protein
MSARQQNMPLNWNDAVAAGQKISSHLSEVAFPLCHLPLLQVFLYRMPRGWRVNSHQHSYYELSLVLSGRARDEQGQQQVIGPGGIFLHGPHQSHSWCSPYGVCQRLVICFDVDPSLPFEIPGRWPCWSHLLESAWNMLLAAHDDLPGWQNRSMAHLSVILAEAMTLLELPKTAVDPVGKPDDLVDKVDAFLEDNLANPINLSDVAANSGVSLSQLTHAYQRQRGQTVGQRLITLRMEQAAYLLRETSLPLKNVSREVGINQSAYLCRLFRKHFRTTPGLYRQRNA